MRVLRQPATTRLTHGLITIAFLVLAVTGTMLHFHLRSHAFSAKNLHLLMAVGMLGVGAGYYAQALMNGTIARLILRKRDLPKLVPMAQYYAGSRSEAPEYDGYNPLQRAAYTGVLFIVAPVLALSGLALWPHVAFAHSIAMLFGGRSAGIWHLIFAISLVLFVAGHTLMVVATGFINNVRSMINGWYEVEPRAASPRELKPGTAGKTGKLAAG